MLTRDLVTLPQGNQEPLAVKTRMEEMLYHCRLGDRKGIRPVKVEGRHDGDDSLTGALNVL